MEDMDAMTDKKNITIIFCRSIPKPIFEIKFGTSVPNLLGEDDLTDGSLGADFLVFLDNFNKEPNCR